MATTPRSGGPPPSWLAARSSSASCSALARSSGRPRPAHRMLGRWRQPETQTPPNRPDHSASPLLPGETGWVARYLAPPNRRIISAVVRYVRRQRAAAPRWPVLARIGIARVRTDLLLEDSTVVSKAMWITMLANPLDMNVSTFGSLLLRLSHHRNGLSTHPPSKLGTFPSKFPRDPPNRSTSPCVLQQSCPVSTPLAGIPATLKLNASVPTGENSSWLSPMELKYWMPWSRATVDGW